MLMRIFGPMRDREEEKEAGGKLHELHTYCFILLPFAWKLRIVDTKI
jgi:hypothetical protein